MSGRRRSRPEEDRPRKTSVTLTPEAEYLLQRLRERWSLSISGSVEQAVRRASQEEGIFLPPVLKTAPRAGGE